MSPAIRNLAVSRQSRAIGVALLVLLLPVPACAHNRPVHQDMVEFAYETMLYLSAPRLQVGLHPPEGADPAEWHRFLQALAATPAKWRDQPSSLQRLNLEKLKSPPVKPLTGVTPGNAGPATAQITCSGEVYGQTTIPDEWGHRPFEDGRGAGGLAEWACARTRENV